MFRAETRADPLPLGLAALGWTVGEPSRAERLLALTGLQPDELRRRAGEPRLLAAVLNFLESHELDLVACAQALDATPEALVNARRSLEA